MPAINQIVDTVPLQGTKTGLDIFSAGLADGAGKIVDSGGSTVWNWDADGSIHAKGLPRVIHANVTPVANTVATEQDLMSFTVPAGLMANDGDLLRIRARHDIAPADSVILQFYAGSGGFNIGDPLAYIAFGPVYSEITLCRTGATTGLADWSIFGYLQDSSSGQTHAPIETEELSLVWANANVIKSTVTCLNGTGGEATQRLFQVVYEPAPV